MRHGIQATLTQLHHSSRSTEKSNCGSLTVSILRFFFSWRCKIMDLAAFKAATHSGRHLAAHIVQIIPCFVHEHFVTFVSCCSCCYRGLCRLPCQFVSGAHRLVTVREHPVLILVGGGAGACLHLKRRGEELLATVQSWWQRFSSCILASIPGVRFRWRPSKPLSP